MPRDRLTLGVPFYGYDFSNANNVKALTYNQIINLDPNNAYRDQYDQIYYNGIPTIQKKTNLALEQLSGIMIWELGHDHYSEYSLLSAIDEVINPLSFNEEFVHNEPTVYPNPFYDRISIQLNDNASGVYQLSNLNGEVILNGSFVNRENVEILTTNLNQGIYALMVKNNDKAQTFKVVKG